MDLNLRSIPYRLIDFSQLTFFFFALIHDVHTLYSIEECREFLPEERGTFDTVADFCSFFFFKVN